MFSLTSFTPAAEPPQPNDWTQWRPLLGKWTATGTGKPGDSTGEISFALELHDRVIVRKSHSDYPAAADRPAFSHDDLMIIYQEEGKNGYEANYYDSEGHTIHYTAEFSKDGANLVFLSSPVPSRPSFRLTYTWSKPDEVKIKFEIALPDKPKDFKTYVEGTAHRAGAAG